MMSDFPHTLCIQMHVLKENYDRFFDSHYERSHSILL